MISVLKNNGVRRWSLLNVKRAICVSWLAIYISSFDKIQCSIYPYLFWFRPTCLVLTHWNNIHVIKSIRLDLLLHQNTLSWLLANQSLLLLLNAARLAEKHQNINQLQSLVWANRWSKQRPTARQAHEQLNNRNSK